MICVLAATHLFTGTRSTRTGTTSGQSLILYTPAGQPGGGPGGGPDSGAGGAGPILTPSALRAMHSTALGLAGALGSRQVVELDTTSANLQHVGAGRPFSGQVYVATPQLLAAFGISTIPWSAAPRSSPCARACPGSRTCSSPIAMARADPAPRSLPDPHRAPAPARRAGRQRHPPAVRPAARRQPDHPIRQRSSRRDLRPQYGDHRARRALARYNHEQRLAHPDPAGAHRSTDHERPAHGVRRRDVGGDEERSTDLGRDPQLGDGLRRPPRTRRSRHDGRVDPERNSERPRVLTAAGAGSSTRRSLTAAAAGALALLGALFGTLGGYVAVVALERQLARRPGQPAQRAGQEPPDHPGRHAPRRLGRGLGPGRT